MAEDTVPTCKRGHLRTPENVLPDRNCKECHRITDRAAHARYRARGRGRIIDARYNATVKSWVVSRRYKLKGRREAIRAELDALAREGEECRRWLRSFHEGM